LGRDGAAAQEGLISNPVRKAKSVILTEEGQREAERLFAEMFAAAPAATHC
jgi:hypothetical protein